MTDKIFIVNDQPTDTDALNFTTYVQTLADIAATGNTPLAIGVFGRHSPPIVTNRVLMRINLELINE